jgi:phosphoribosylanthranilate isomerase
MTRSTPLIKICGTTSPRDAQWAAQAGADYLGIVVEHPPSPRSLPLEEAVAVAAATTLPVVAVTVNLPLQRLLRIHRVLRPAALQLHGDETAELVRALRAVGITVWGVAGGTSATARRRATELVDAGATAIVVDARAVHAGATIYGGTGETADWSVARELAEAGRRVILAGGLTPRNVAQAIAEAQPWMVDVVSGVETAKGRKDETKIRAFVAAARAES